MNSIINKSKKSISGWAYSKVSLNSDSDVLNQHGKYSTSKNERTSARLLALSVIEELESLKNMEINSTKLTEFKTLLRSFASFCNSNFMNDFPIEIVDMPIGNVYFAIKSWYSSELNLSNALKFVVEAFKELDTISGSNINDSSTRCMDALLILIQYANLVIFSRFDHGLIIQQKKPSDGIHSSNPLASRSSLANGDKHEKFG